MLQQILFWGALGLILYAYIGFPILLLIRGLFIRRKVGKEEITPTVSMIITAHNEAKSIGAKLENILELNYPLANIQIIVASDGSNDGTNEIVAGYAGQGVHLLALPRQGKIPCMNEAVNHATGEILVFSDANSMYAPDALRSLIRPFADPAVGAVGGNQCYVKSDKEYAAGFGERIFWNFDRTLKTLQSRSGNMISATGAIHAIRRNLFQPVPLSVCDDFVISTRAVMQGYWLVFAPDAIAYETIAPTARAEFQRKARVVLRAIRSLWTVRKLLNPFRYGFYSVQLISHKLLRWSVGWLLIVLFGASLSLYRAGIFYQLFTLGQAAFYLCALITPVLRQTPLSRLKIFKLLTIPYFFSMANLAALWSWIQFIFGRRIDVWDSKREAGESQGISSLASEVFGATLPQGED